MYLQIAMQELFQYGPVTPYGTITLCQYSDNGLWSWFGQWLEGTKLLPGPISTNINVTMCSPEAISEEILKSILDTNLKIIALLL